LRTGHDSRLCVISPSKSRIGHICWKLGFSRFAEGFGPDTLCGSERFWLNAGQDCSRSTRVYRCSVRDCGPPPPPLGSGVLRVHPWSSYERNQFVLALFIFACAYSGGSGGQPAQIPRRSGVVTTKGAGIEACEYYVDQQSTGADAPLLSGNEDATPSYAGSRKVQVRVDGGSGFSVLQEAHTA